MRPLLPPLSITVYQDVLCAWSYLADLRLEPLRRDFGAALRWKVRPFPLRIHDTLPSDKELRELREGIQRACAEPEAQSCRISHELWTAGDPPCSSVPALAALEAARLQGPLARAALARAMQRAALEQAINVTRSDVVFELASRVGLEMNRFAAAFASPHTRSLIVQEYRSAASRGVRDTPTLVIGGRWMVRGLREAAEYREHILWCMSKASSTPEPGGTFERMLH